MLPQEHVFCEFRLANRRQKTLYGEKQWTFYIKLHGKHTLILYTLRLTRTGDHVMSKLHDSPYSFKTLFIFVMCKVYNFSV
jgi:hypothetical protein